MLPILEPRTLFGSCWFQLRPLRSHISELEELRQGITKRQTQVILGVVGSAVSRHSLVEPGATSPMVSCRQDALGANQPGHHPAGAAIAGAAATVFHDAIMTPMDVVKQRLQLGYHRGMWDCARTIQRTEGMQVRWIIAGCS